MILCIKDAYAYAINVCTSRVIVKFYCTSVHTQDEGSLFHSSDEIYRFYVLDQALFFFCYLEVIYLI